MRLEHVIICTVTLKNYIIFCEYALKRLKNYLCEKPLLPQLRFVDVRVFPRDFHWIWGDCLNFTGLWSFLKIRRFEKGFTITRFHLKKHKM